MKKNILKAILVLTTSIFLLSGCATKEAETTKEPETKTTTETTTTETTTEPTAEVIEKLVTVKIGATAIPHAEILEIIKDDLKAKGVDLQIEVFADYLLLNQALADKQIDANFFQHTPFFDNYVLESKQKLVSLGNVHIEPMGIYSDKIKDLKDLADGSAVAIPNDATNEGRALLLLQSNGLIKLKDGTGFIANLNDIVEGSNVKNLKITEIDAALLPRTLADVDVAVINTNYALVAGLNPLKDSIAIEGNDSPYANILAIREEDIDSKELKEVYTALTSEKVREFLLKTYEGAVVPAF